MTMKHVLSMIDKIKMQLNKLNYTEVDLAIDEKTDGYTRTICTSKLNVSKKIEKLYGGYKYTYIVPSGMNAIYLCLNKIYELNSKNKKNITFMLSNELYEDTEELVINNLIDKNVDVIRFDQTNLEDFKSKKKNIHIDCVFVESCSNPSGLMTNWDIFKYCDNDTIKIVDNTWLSPISFNPFKFGSDIVVESCTKYLSGGKCIAGHITFNKYDSLTESIENEIEVSGSHVSPLNCMIIDKMIDSILERIEMSSSKTIQLLEKMALNSRIKNVKYPFDMVYDKKYKYPPSVIYMNIQISPKSYRLHNDVLERKLDTSSSDDMVFDIYKEYIRGVIQFSGLHNRTSYGKIYDTINNLKYSDIEKDSIWLRLSIGYNDDNINILYNKLEKIIESI